MKKMVAIAKSKVKQPKHSPKSVNEVFEMMRSGKLTQQQASEELRRLQSSRHSWFERNLKLLAS